MYFQAFKHSTNTYLLGSDQRSQQFPVFHGPDSQIRVWRAIRPVFILPGSPYDIELVGDHVVAVRGKNDLACLWQLGGEKLTSGLGFNHRRPE